MNILKKLTSFEVAGSIGILIIAFSILFHYVISPSVNKMSLSSCLQDIQDQKTKIDESNAVAIKEYQEKIRHPHFLHPPMQTAHKS